MKFSWPSKKSCIRSLYLYQNTCNYWFMTIDREMIHLPSHGALSVKYISDRVFHPSVYLFWFHLPPSCYIFFVWEQSSQETRFQGEHARNAEENRADVMLPLQIFDLRQFYRIDLISHHIFLCKKPIIFREYIAK